MGTQDKTPNTKKKPLRRFIMDEAQIQQLALLFMGQYSHPVCHLSAWLEENKEELTDDERNLGFHILSLFHSDTITMHDTKI